MTRPPNPAHFGRRKPQILFAHDRWPGQFGGFARWLAAKGWDVRAATGHPAAAAAAATATATVAGGVRVIRYAPHRPPSPATHPYAQAFDRAALVGQACLRRCIAARADGLDPDIVVSHTGPGAGLFLGELFPKAAHVAYCEWWYNAPGVDTAWLAAARGERPPRGPEAAILEHCRNQPIAQELLSAGQGLCPTAFQAAQFPPALRGMLRVQHDGVDCAHFSPGPPGRARHTALAGLADDTPLVTYATRGMEPHRGFPQVMAAFAEVQARHPRAVTVIAGDNGVHYGGNAERRTDWKTEALARLALDPRRTLFTGTLDPGDYLWLLRRSDAHVYATVPFVLSWSMLDAMAAATPLVLSDTAPVREFADADCARLADLADPSAIAEAILDLLADPLEARRLGRAARDRVRATCDAARIYPDKAAWLGGLAHGERSATGPMPQPAPRVARSPAVDHAAAPARTRTPSGTAPVRGSVLHR